MVVKAEITSWVNDDARGSRVESGTVHRHLLVSFLISAYTLTSELHLTALKMPDVPQQDLEVVLEHDKRGLLTVEEGRLDVLQLSKDGRREWPERVYSCPVARRAARPSE